MTTLPDSPTPAVEGARCIAVDPNCAECSRRLPHECGELCEMLAEMVSTPDGHEAWHSARRCSGCGEHQYDEDGRPRDVSRRCRYGRCVNWHCPTCDQWHGGHGPVSCPCDTTWLTRSRLRWRRWRDRRRARDGVA